MEYIYEWNENGSDWFSGFVDDAPFLILAASEYAKSKG